MPEDEPTCGDGLAANAALPEKAGGLIGAMTAVLELHMQAIDLSDEGSRPEYEAYREVTRRGREAAGLLADLARTLEGYRGLPMATHDMEAMTHPRMREAFEAYVAAKQELGRLLEETAAGDQEMLEQM